jgi:DNA-binding response OmpR family regulator
MLILVDERESVTAGYAGRFHNEGVHATGLRPGEFREWLGATSSIDLFAVEAFLIGDCPQRASYPKLIRGRSQAPIIAMSESPSLEGTLELFAGGVDDVVRKPIHVREILARVGAIQRRMTSEPSDETISDMRVYFDGRDPEIRGEVLPLPRRERRILEYLVKNRGRRVSRTQIFNAVYGLFDEDVEESVVESHVSKLRRKLRDRLGYDPIESKRYLGYCLGQAQRDMSKAPAGRDARLAVLAAC